MTSEHVDAGFRFLDLPAEIREDVYGKIFDPSAVRTPRNEEGLFSYRYDFALFYVNRQIYFEARKVFRQLNIFVLVETPWEDAEKHIASEGLIPLLAAGDSAISFRDYMLAIEIDSHHEGLHVDQLANRMIILADDLEAFTRMWFYTDLNYEARLNPNLKLTLRLRDPYDDLGVKALPTAIQARLLLPFGNVKGIHSLEIIGQRSESVEQTLRSAMAVPYDPPEKCLMDSTRLKDEGDAALSKKDPRRAIELYIAAFEKIHIVCVGRRRSIFSDAWFERQFTEGQLKDKYGQVIRLILRVSLVANVIKAYLDLREYEEAEFWGMRSIRLARGAVGLAFDEEGDEPLLNFPASPQMGMIYYQTGVACKALGKTDEARKLFRVAKLYLPHDESVDRELTWCR